MGVNFTPTLNGYTGVGPFRFWCQTALPLVYDDSLSYYELLNKVVHYLNEVIKDVSSVEDNVQALLGAFNQLQDYVNHYFDNLDVQEEINNKLDALAQDGTLSELISPFVSELIGGVVADQIGDTVASQIGATVAGQIVPVVAEQLRGSYGSPLVSSTLAGMTDRQRVYVYTGIEADMTNGDWYYWDGTQWSSGGVYNSEAITVDDELDENSINPVQNKVVTGAVTDLKSALTPIETAVPKIIYKLELAPPSPNRFDKTKAQLNRYMLEDGSIGPNSEYYLTALIPVTEGEVIRVFYKTSNTFTKAINRFITAFDSDGHAVAASGGSQIQVYTVPEGITGIRITIYTIYDIDFVMVLADTTSVSEYIPYYESYYIAKKDFIEKAVSQIPANIPIANNFVYTASADSLSNDETLTAISNLDNKKNDKIAFYCNLESATFNSVCVGHGYNQNYGSYVKVDDTNVYVYSGSTVYATIAHGLTIDKFLYIEVRHTNTARADIYIVTSSGSKAIASGSVAWDGCRGDVFAKSVNSTLTNCKLDATFPDFLEDIYLCGDSYVGLGDTARWPYYMIQNGFTKICINGFGGATSANEILTFRNIVAKAKPKYFVWCLGMNDVDSGAINASYKSCLDEVIATCEEKGIIPILATIPNTPTVNNTYKNAYVKSLGYRYIDFAKAVNAESAGATWYSGMLANDNVHPTALGAKALYAQFVMDVPEILK